jgi:hypothetical protein
VDVDGKATYSNVVSVNFNSAEINSFTITPNPVQLVIQLNFHSKTNQQATVLISDVAGRIVSTSKIYLVKGNQLISLDNAVLNSGAYFISIQLKDGKLAGKFIKQ